MSIFITLIGMIRTQAILMFCFDILISSSSTIFDDKIYFENCHFFYNTEGIF